VLIKVIFFKGRIVIIAALKQSEEVLPIW